MKGFTQSARSASSMDDISASKEQSNPSDSSLAARSSSRKKRFLLASIVAGVVILALALGLGLGLGLKSSKKSESYPSETYALVEQYQGSNFFDKFDYWSAADPTDGFVLYQLRANAEYENYTYASNASAIIRSATTATETGINSVRIQSSLNFTQGLFVVDVAHMPVGCGIWPAFWTSDTANWPDNGEIDILEGVNLNTHNQMTLHTTSGCTMKGVSRNETGTVLTNDCASGSSSTGCGVNDTDHGELSYGSGFNNNGGGMFAMDWRSNGIRVWFFPRSSLPADLTILSDDPESTAVPSMSDWGTPSANFEASHCDIDTHFSNHKVIFDTTFCGDWAGAAKYWNSTTCYAEYDTCEAYMKSNPADLVDAYWEIKSLNVYQIPDSGATEAGSEFASTSTSATAATSATSSAARGAGSAAAAAIVEASSTSAAVVLQTPSVKS